MPRRGSMFCVSSGMATTSSASGSTASARCCALGAPAVRRKLTRAIAVTSRRVMCVILSEHGRRERELNQGNPATRLFDVQPAHAGAGHISTTSPNRKSGLRSQYHVPSSRKTRRLPIRHLRDAVSGCAHAADCSAPPGKGAPAFGGSCDGLGMPSSPEVSAVHRSTDIELLAREVPLSLLLV